jgi:hypothetical protein
MWNVLLLIKVCVIGLLSNDEQTFPNLVKEGLPTNHPQSLDSFRGFAIPYKNVSARRCPSVLECKELTQAGFAWGFDSACRVSFFADPSVTSHHSLNSVSRPARGAPLFICRMRCAARRGDLMAADNGAGDAKKITYGEVFANGEALELVASPLSENLQLIHWSGNDLRIGLQFRVGEVLYQAPRLHASILMAVRFPITAREYGSSEDLFAGIANLIRQATGLDEASAMGAALWIRASWFAGLWPSPPLLHVTGPEKQVLRLLRLLGALCRRGLMVAEFTRRLPFFLQPTFIIYDPNFSPKRQAWWRATNHVGIFIGETGGLLRNLASAKALYLGENDDSPDAWGPEALRLNLLPTLRPLPEWSDFEERQVSDLYQSQLLMLRLKTLPRFQQATSSARATTVNSELARNLLVGMQDAPDIVKSVTPLFVAQLQKLSARRSTDPKAIIVETLWGPAHELSQFPVSEITKRVNATLQSRDRIELYTEKEVGWKLRQMGIPRRPNGKGRVVSLSSEVRRRLHVLAQQFGLMLPRKEDCPDCKESQIDVVQVDG